ncbi:unnamed protein product, partial [Urochloa humidicola]
MEEKKKELLRKLTIISIPFVFVAIPSVVIIVGMLSPHAEPVDGSAPVPAGRNHSLTMLSTMTGGQMILSCRAAFSGNWDGDTWATSSRTWSSSTAVRRGRPSAASRTVAAATCSRTATCSSSQGSTGTAPRRPRRSPQRLMTERRRQGHGWHQVRLLCQHPRRLR